MTATMQLLAKMKRKNSAEKTVTPITTNNIGSSTNIVDPKSAKPSSPRSGFHVFKPKFSPPPPSPPNSLTSSTPPPAYTATASPPNTPHPNDQSRAGQTAGNAQPTSRSNPPRPQQQRPMVRIPSLLYCPTLEKNGHGYGNEEARQSTAL